MKLATKLLAMLLAIVLVVCLIPAVFAVEDGTELNPYVVVDENSAFGTDVELQSVDAAYQNKTYFSMTAVGSGVAVINVNYIAPVDDPWGSIEADAVSIGCLNKTTDTYAYTDIMTWQGVTSGTIYVPISSGDELLFDFMVGLPMDYEDCLLGLNISLAGSRENPIVVNGNPTKLSASSEMVVYYTGNWMSFGGASIYQEYSMQNRNPSVADLTAYVAGETWTDTDEDQKVELTLSEDSVSYTTTIGLIHEGNGIKEYTVALTADAQFECDHSNVTDVPAQEAGCHSIGWNAHLVCECGTYLMDTDANPETDPVEVTEDEVFLAPLNALPTLVVSPDPPTCTEPGVLDYYHCETCGGNTWDAEGLEEIGSDESLIGEATGHQELKYYEAFEGNCCEAAYIEHWWCWDCWKYYLDEACTQEVEEADIYADELDYTNHKWIVDTSVGENFDGVLQEHSCTQDGKVQYKCEYGCVDNEGHQVWMEGYEDMPIVTKIVVTPAHNLTHNEEVPATKDDEGVKEHWYCEDCEKFFANAEATKELTAAELVIPKLTDGDNPNTGDNGILFVALAAVVSLAGVMVLSKKKFF